MCVCVLRALSVLRRTRSRVRDYYHTDIVFDSSCDGIEDL